MRARAEAGVASAQFSLGFRYNTGQGVPQDYVEAARAGFVNLAC
jgi:TPR repeat protein